MFKLGLVSISFRALAPEEIIVKMKESGLKYVEWGSDVHAKPNDKKRLIELRDMCEREGIGISSYGSYFKLAENPISELPMYIDAAKTLGVDIIRIWCGNKNYTDMGENERRAFISLSREAAKIAENSGVTLCMECHNNTFTNCLEGALRLMEEVNSPAFQMHWQPNQFLSHEENVLFAKKMAKYTRVIHAFHWIGTDKFPLSEGADRWREYLGEFSGDEFLLLEFMPDGQVKTLPREADSLKSIVSRMS